LRGDCSLYAKNAVIYRKNDVNMHLTHILVALERIVAPHNKTIFHPSQAGQAKARSASASTLKAPKGPLAGLTGPRKPPRVGSHRDEKEMTMTTATFSNALLPLAGTDASVEPSKVPVRRSLFLRIIDALQRSRAAHARREIIRVQAMLGLTDADREALARGELPFRS
jgi:hypothetical protein